MNIQEAIKILAYKHGENYCKICTVDRVNFEARTVDASPIDDDAPIFDVNLQSNQDGKKGFVAFPKIGTHVVVAFISDAVALVVLMEEIDKVEFVVGDKKPVEITVEDNSLKLSINGTTIEVTGDKKITFNSGNNGGLVISQNTADKLSAIEQDVNALKSIFSGWTPVPQDGGAALKGVITSWAGQQLTITKKNDLENSDIKH